jgi:rhodanese-like protein
MLRFRLVLQSSSKGGLPQMRQLVAATAVVGFLASGLAYAQMKSAVPPGNASPEVKAPIPVAQAPLESARRITREEAIKLIKAKKAVFVDVRPKDAYDQSHIRGAISIPLGDVLTRVKEIPPKTFIITYCA